MATRTCICSRKYDLFTRKTVSQCFMLSTSTQWRQPPSGAVIARSIASVTEPHFRKAAKVHQTQSFKAMKQKNNLPIQFSKSTKTGKPYSVTKALLRKNFSRILRNKQPTIDGQPVEPATIFMKMAKLPIREICDILYVYLYKWEGKAYRRNKAVFLEAASYWPIETLVQFFEGSGSCHMQFRLDLMNQVLIPKYRQTRDLNVLLRVLPPSIVPPQPSDTHVSVHKDTLPLYNAALNATQKAKEFDHMERIFQLMQERHIPLDAASYNIMIDAKLTNHQKSLLPKEIYDGLLTKLFVPTQATFHIFMKHDIGRQNWRHLGFWLDTMREYSMTPNRVTHRLLFKALAKYPNEPALVSLIDRLASTTVVQSSVVKQQKQQQPLLLNISEDARDVLRSAYKISQQPIYAYNLLLKYLCQKGDVVSAREVLDNMTRTESLPEPDTVSFTTVFHGILRHKRHIDIGQVNSIYDGLKEYGMHSNVLKAVAFYGTLKSNNYQNIKQVLQQFDSLMKDEQHTLSPPLDAMNIYNMIIDFYFNHYHHSSHLKDKIPTEAFSLFAEATEQKGLRPSRSTLNIMIRGLAFFHGDLIAADKLLKAFHAKGIEMNERTCWYLASAAVRKGYKDRAIQYIQDYEQMGGSIRGSGLLDLKNSLLKQ